MKDKSAYSKRTGNPTEHGLSEMKSALQDDGSGFADSTAKSIHNQSGNNSEANALGLKMEAVDSGETAFSSATISKNRPRDINWASVLWLFVLLVASAALFYVEYQRFNAEKVKGMLSETAQSLQIKIRDVALQTSRIRESSPEERISLNALKSDALSELTKFERILPLGLSVRDANETSQLTAISRLKYTIFPEIDLLLKNHLVLDSTWDDVESMDDLIFKLSTQLNLMIGQVVEQRLGEGVAALLGEQNVLLERVKSNAGWLVRGRTGIGLSVSLVKADMMKLESNNRLLLENGREIIGAWPAELLDDFAQLDDSVGDMLKPVEASFWLQNSVDRVTENSLVLAKLLDQLELDIATSAVFVNHWIFNQRIRFVLIALALMSLACFARVSGNRGGTPSNSDDYQGSISTAAIDQLIVDLQEFTNGDLTVHSETSDEMADALTKSVNFAVKSMRLMVEEIRSASWDVDECTKEMGSLISRFRLDNETQYAQVAGIYGDVRKVTDVIDFFYKNASESSQWLSVSVDAATEGASNVRQTVQGMGAARTQVQDTLGRLRRLSDHSQQISDLTKGIQSVSERTNVLSLNASIQAAMAGEAGKGFAVVVEEVQKLAERSADASGRIEELVKNINQDINNAVFLMETTTKEIASGVRMTDETEAVFDRIKSTNQQLMGSISQFSGGSEEELETMESISDRIEMLNISSRRNNSNASEVANAMGQLKIVAQRLNRSIMGFRVD
ncbi:MAG: hypothetical protein GKR96_00075 [Gammaproteobacteria bacterium]|nr:hypothetical protein [Gammaproteobacteria bacterium]